MPIIRDREFKYKTKFLLIKLFDVVVAGFPTFSGLNFFSKCNLKLNEKNRGAKRFFGFSHRISYRGITKIKYFVNT
jgi:hypothetical protein